MYKRGLFHDWVPKPVQLLLILIFTVPLLTINGIYTSNISDMVGGLGILTEDLMMANYAASIGMMVVFPLIMRTKQRFKSKTLLLFAFVSFTILSCICATTVSAPILIGANFLMGMVKMVGMIEVIIPIMFIVSPQGDRAKFYSVFYPLSIGMGMLSSYFTSIISYEYNWQYVYSLAIPVLLLCILLVIVFCHNHYGQKPVPLYQFDWLSMAVISVSMMLLNYVFSYGKMLNWFDSSSIPAALIASAIFTLVFIRRQLMLKRPYLGLAVFRRKNVYMALLLFFAMGAFFSTSSIQSAFTTGILKYSAQTNAWLNLWMAAGAVLGGVICFFWFKHDLGIKGLIFMGFASFTLYHILLYFLFAPVIDLNYMVLPSLLKGLGMTLLYIGLGVFAAQKLGMVEMLSSASVLVLFRSFIGPAFWGAVYSLQLYAGQLKHTAALAQRMDAQDPFFTSRLNPTIQGAMAQGQSVEAAQSLGIQSMWGAVQLQATLAAAKELFGYVILAGFLVLLFVILFRFGKVNLRRWVKLRKRLRWKEMIKNEEEMVAALPQ